MLSGVESFGNGLLNGVTQKNIIGKTAEGGIDYYNTAGRTLGKLAYNKVFSGKRKPYGDIMAQYAREM